MDARHYAYRNISQKAGSDRMWSVKFRGRVEHRGDIVILNGCTFSVSAVGRARVLKEKRKNVHAHVVAESLSGFLDPELNISDATEITYNPYKHTAFVTVDHTRQWAHPVESAEIVMLCSNGKVYAWGVTEADIDF